MSKPKTAKQRAQEPPNITEERLDELMANLQGFNEKFHELWFSDSDPHTTMQKLFDLIDSIESREERFATLVIFLNMVVGLTAQATLIGVLQAANKRMGEDSGSGGGNGEPKN